MSTTTATTTSTTPTGTTPTGTVPSFDNLARDLLDTVPGMEVVTSLVELPPHFRPPVHTHPGEEFAYVIDGTIWCTMEGHEEFELPAGSTAKVPVGTVHTIRTGDQPAKLVVFRVHPVGQPERILVDDA